MKRAVTRGFVAGGFLLGAYLAGAGAAGAAEPAAFKCAFSSGQAFVYEKGVFGAENVKPMAIVFKSIDRSRQTATMEAAGGATPVKLVLAVNALHVLEVAGEGFLNVTTIYDRDDATGAYPAVHSRHFGVLGQAVVSQYQGRCTAE